MRELDVLGIRPHALALVLLAIGTGCGQVSHDSGRRHDPDDLPLACNDLEARPFALVEPTVSDVGMSACGDLAFTTPGDSLRVTDSSLANPQIVESGVMSFEFTPLGERLIYVRDGVGLQARTLADGTTTAPLAVEGSKFDVVHTGGRDRVLMCGNSGLDVIDPVLLEQSVLAPDEKCLGVDTRPFARWAVLSSNDDRLFAIDLKSQSAKPIAIDLPALPSDQYLSTEHQLSDDGRVLIHRMHVDEACGDTVCGTKASVSLIDLSGPDVASEVSVVPNGCCGGPGPAPYLTSDPHSVLVDVGSGVQYLGANLAIANIAGVQPRYLFRDGSALVDEKFSSGESKTVRMDLASTEPIDSFGDVDSFAVSADESVVAYSHFTSDCVKYPDQPNVCHAQIWALDVMGSEKRTGVVSSTQPIDVLWAGGRGHSLLAAGLPAGPLPSVAFPDELPPITWGVHLIGLDGSVLATLSDEINTSSMTIYEAGGTLVIDAYARIGESWTRRLYAVGIESGGAMALVDGDGFDLFFDHARERLAARVERNEETMRFELWAGAVPVL